MQMTDAEIILETEKSLKRFECNDKKEMLEDARQVINVVGLDKFILVSADAVLSYREDVARLESVISEFVLTILENVEIPEKAFDIIRSVMCKTGGQVDAFTNEDMMDA